MVDLCAQATTIADSLYVTDRAFEIAPDTVVAMDTGEQALLLMDLNSGTVYRVGQQGHGPGEFQNPGPVIRLPEGVIGVPDRPDRLLHLFRSDGSFIRAARLPKGIFLESEFHSDSSGLLYVVLNDRAAGTAEGGDSVPVVSFRLDSESTDTVWHVRGPDTRQFPTGDGGTAFMPLPFSTHVVFGVSWNGLMWRIGSEPPRVATRRASGPLETGEIWDDPALLVTNDDRDSVMAEFATSRIPGIQLEFADYKPLFTDARIAPWGEAWVRLTELRDGLAMYRIHDSTGAAVDSMTVDPACAVAGFGTEKVFLIRTGETGFSSLLSAAWPISNQSSSQLSFCCYFP